MDGEIRNWLEIAIVGGGAVAGAIGFVFKVKELIAKDEVQEKEIAMIREDVRTLQHDNISHKKDFDSFKDEIKRLTNAVENLTLNLKFVNNAVSN